MGSVLILYGILSVNINITTDTMLKFDADTRLIFNANVTRMHSSRIRTAHSLSYEEWGGSPLQRPPWTETSLDIDPPPWTETPLDRDPPVDRLRLRVVNIDTQCERTSSAGMRILWFR